METATTNLLLLVIAVSEILRLTWTHKKTTRKEHFSQKQDGVEKMIWDLEFKKFKTEEIREDVRKEYAYMTSRIASLEDQIKNWPKDKDEGDRKRLEDQKTIAERDASRFQAQLKALDEEVHGAKPSNENPSGSQGITHQIDSLRELQAMLADWKKHI